MSNAYSFTARYNLDSFGHNYFHHFSAGYSGFYPASPSANGFLLGDKKMQFHWKKSHSSFDSLACLDDHFQLENLYGDANCHFFLLDTDQVWSLSSVYFGYLFVELTTDDYDQIP